MSSPTPDSFVRLCNCILNRKYEKLERFYRFNLIPLMDNSLLEIVFQDFPHSQQIYLLENSVDLNCRDAEGWTPLHHAIRYGKWAVINYLLDRSDIEAETDKGWRPIHFACIYSSEAAVWLLEKGVEVDRPTNDGFYPIHLALRHTRSKRVFDLLSEKANLEVCDAENWRPIHYALRHSQIDFLRKSKLDRDAVTSNGQTVEQFATRFLTPLQRSELGF